MNTIKSRFSLDAVLLSITAKDVVENIRSCEEMTTLTLSGNTIGVEAAKAIAEALESKATFEVRSARLIGWFLLLICGLLCTVSTRCGVISLQEDSVLRYRLLWYGNKM